MAEPRRWELVGAWLMGAGLCSQAVRSILDREPALPDAELWASLATQGIWLCLALAFASLARGETVPARLGLGPGRLRASSVALLAFGILALSNGISTLLGSLELRDTGTLGEMKRMVEEADGPSVALALLCFGVAPGIAEEILFRGLLQRGLARRLGRGLAIGLAAALFGAVHADPIQSSAAFVLGLYLGAVAELAGSIRAAMVCHVANNVSATVAARLGGLPIPGELPVGVLLGGGLALGAACLAWVWHREGAPEPQAPGPRGSPPERGADGPDEPDPGGGHPG